MGTSIAGRTIIAHLGNGASMAAIRDGQPLDTTMGLTPTGGFMMGTRSIDLDPQRNAGHADRISSDHSLCTVRVIPTNEELMIARHTRALVFSQEHTTEN